MSRWQPGASERLVVAAVDLFTEQGYDATTVAQIAERAGVTKSTFFRHFTDKRELLVAGQQTLSRLLAGGITERPRTPARWRRSPPVLSEHQAPWGQRIASSAPASKRQWRPAPSFRNAMPSKASVWRPP